MENLIIAILFVWCGILTVAFLFVFVHNKKRSRRQENVNTDEGLRSTISTIERALAQQEKSARKYIQKVGFLKFNPFAETGGAQSFAVALLDQNDDGFVLTSLHSRAGTRTYAKLIEKGKSQTELSKDEEKALQLAQHEETE